MRSNETHLLTVEEHHRAADRRACEEILDVLARVRRVKSKWEWFRKHSQTPSCDLRTLDCPRERQDELDDAWDYELMDAIKKERGL